MLAVETVVVLGLSTGCARKADLDLVAGPAGFAATPEYLAEALDVSSSGAYRFSMSVLFHVAGETVGGEVATGAVRGDESRLRLDVGALSVEPTEGDLTQELITTGEALYVRVPFAARMAGDPTSDVPREPGGMFAAFVELGDDWGRIDFGGLGGVTPRAMQEAVHAGRNGDPRVLFDMLGRTEVVEGLGRDEIDGVPVTGLTGDVDLHDMLAVAAAASGPAALSGGGPLDMSSLTFPLEVWVDDDGLVRRIAFTFGIDALSELAEQNDQQVPAEARDYEIQMTMDFLDHGDDSIQIEAPTETVDVTESFVAAYHQMRGSTPDDTTATTTTSGTTLPVEETFFETDFSSGQDWGPVDAPFSYENGRFVIHAAAEGGGTMYGSSPPFPAIGGLRIDVDVDKVETGASTAGAVFGVECSSDPGKDVVDAYQATIDTDGSWSLRRTHLDFVPTPGNTPGELDEEILTHTTPALPVMGARQGRFARPGVA